MSRVRKLRKVKGWCWGAALAVSVGAIVVGPGASATRVPPPPASELAPVAPPTVAAPASDHWVATWTTAPVAPLRHGPSARGFDNQTVRETIRTSVGGPQVRVRLTNAFGSRAVPVGGATLSVDGGPAWALTVDGARNFILPVGASVMSDPVGVPVGTGADLTVSLWLAGPTGPATGHPLSLTTNTLASGDHVADPGAGAFRRTTPSWWFLSGVDVLAPAPVETVVAFGASTTDGEGAPHRVDARWLDDLNRRLDGEADAPSVVNEGISGNRLLAGGPGAGPSGISRFAADAVDQPGVGVVLVSSLGNDDIGTGHHVTAGKLIAGYRQLIADAHAAGVRIVGCTLTPDRGNRMWTPGGQRIQDQVNDWILTSHAFDATVDLAGVLAAPGHPDRLAARLDSGDHLHPDAAGYAAVAAAGAPVVSSLTRLAPLTS